MTMLCLDFFLSHHAQQMGSHHHRYQVGGRCVKKEKFCVDRSVKTKI